MEEKDIVRALTGLAHPYRLRIFRLLVVAGEAGLVPGALAEQLELPAATLSFHLRELMQARLVTQERSGRYLIYRADYPRMHALLDALTANCCQGVPCRETPAASLPPSTDETLP